MARQKKDLLYGVVAAVLAIGAGLVLIVRRRPKPPPSVILPLSIEEPAPDTSPLPEPVKVVRPLSGVFLLVTAGLGLACFTAAQSLLLESRHPAGPLLLYLLGWMALLPALRFDSRRADSSLEALPVHYPNTAFRLNRRTVGASLAVVLCLALTMTLAEPGWLSLIQVILWLAGIAAAFAAARGADQLLPRLNWQRLASLRVELSLLAGLIFAAAIFQSQTPAPGIALPEHTAQTRAVEAAADRLEHAIYTEGGALYPYVLRVLTGAQADLAGLQNASGLFALLTIAGVYLLGRQAEGSLTGLFAAGITAAGLWMLALSKAGNVYAALAACSAFYLFTLHRALGGHGGRSAYLWAGLALGIGWLISPLFLYMALLLPVVSALAWLDKRQTYSQAALNTLAALFVTGVTVFPLMVNLPGAFPRYALPAAYHLQTGVSTTMATFDALATSLLMFNLTADPMPLHGIVSRPAFEPLVAAAFVVGLLVWSWRVYRCWSNGLLLAALVVGMIPSALLIAPPYEYPHLGRAALALPAGIALAASGFTLIAGWLRTLWGRRGVALAAGLFLGALTLIASGARQHYTDTFLPLYEQSAPLYVEMETGR